MVKEENSLKRNKYLYKILLILIKYIPIIVAAFYALNTLFSYLGLDIPVISNFAGMSLFSWIFMYVAAWVFQFCIYHRMFLYYILTTDIINVIDYYIVIPISNYKIIVLHAIITGIFLFLILYFYVKCNKKSIA